MFYDFMPDKRETEIKLTLFLMESSSEKVCTRVSYVWAQNKTCFFQQQAQPGSPDNIQYS